MKKRKPLPNPVIAERMLAAMKEQGLSQNALSKRTGIAQATIGRIVRGEVTPNSGTLETLASHLGVRASHVLGEGPAVENEKSLARPGAKMVSIPRLPTPDADSLDGTNDDDIIVGHLTINRMWLQQRASFSSAANLAIGAGTGDSMAPTIGHGDLFLVDRGVQAINGDAVYVVSLNRQVFVKRMQRGLDGQLSMLSDNPRYRPIQVDPASRENMAVLGRVVLAWNTNRL